MLRIRLKIARNPVPPLYGQGQEFDGLGDPFVGLRATEAEKSAAGVAEALAAQARHAETIVGPFEKIERQTMRSDPQAVAHGADVGKYVERAGGTNDAE